MFAEANRKRRRLEREKRLLERPPPGMCFNLPVMNMLCILIT